jgi:5-methylcytosine-specific restriction endonuclease McrA
MAQLPANWPYSDKRWPALRARALARDRHTCRSCGASLRGKGKARVDHIRPARQAPALAFDLANVRCLCPACDNARHAEKGRRHGQEIPAIGADGFPIGSGW